MTPSNSLKSVALVSLTALATTFLIQACGGSDAMAQVASDADPIEGVWDFTVTRKDCAGGAVLGTQKVQRSVVMAADGNSITGTVAAQTVDTAGVVTAQGCASETGVRVF